MGKKTRNKLFLCRFFSPSTDMKSFQFSGQADASPLHRKAPTLPHHPSQVTLGRIPLSSEPSTLHPSHLTIVQLNSTWNGYKRIGGRLRGNVFVCATPGVCVCSVLSGGVGAWGFLFRLLYVIDGPEVPEPRWTINLWVPVLSTRR